MSRSFGAAKADASQEPIAFDIVGERFEIARPLPGYLTLDLAANAVKGDASAVSAVDDFFRAVFTATDFERFKKATIDARLPLEPNPYVEGSLSELADYILTEATGHPLEQPSSSVVTPLNGGTTSQDAVSNVG